MRAFGLLAVRLRMVERSRFETFAARLLPDGTCGRSAGRERRPSRGRRCCRDSVRPSGADLCTFVRGRYDGVVSHATGRDVGAGVIGRDGELDTISTFLDSPDDRGGALVLEGPPGIGKTTLWRRGFDDAERRGYRVIACSAAVSEAQLSFTALRDLLEVAFDEVADRLPPPQRRALEVALLRAEPEGSAQGPAAVAAAFLAVLRELASSTRLLVAIDDVQWLDSASALVLQFAARRLEHEPVRLLLTVRSDRDAPSLDLVRSLGDRAR